MDARRHPHPGLDVVFAGTSVSTTSAARGHYYSHQSNRLWELLEKSGLTRGVRLRPDEDRRLLEFGLGITDLVKGRATSSDSDLTPAISTSRDSLIGYVKARPVVVAFNGGKVAAAAGDDPDVLRTDNLVIDIPPSEEAMEATLGPLRSSR